GNDGIYGGAGNDAAYGTGLIGRRQYLELDGTLSHLNNAESMALAELLPALHVAGLLPGWGTQTLKMPFGDAMAKL
ncbi:MAG TPA: hypothetical protein PLF63_15365, partial [Rubrivivax sp.]|nr:hypothetical protein [Rubrivivax sp.]